MMLHFGFNTYITCGIVNTYKLLVFMNQFHWPCKSVVVSFLWIPEIQNNFQIIDLCAKCFSCVDRFSPRFSFNQSRFIVFFFVKLLDKNF
ncbi:unnamed protein product [Litomosoides sigmodontis]|uniref:Uncharacterized protein n=1 Tax=Litomosoides sigmodontis TaxID=42156 RepID=A0A3P6U112_LITSI|nr:unnamed protein product [Litomosoides sigmodontis]